MNNQNIKLIALAIVATLNFVWPIAHVTTLRELLLTASFLLLGYCWLKEKERLVELGDLIRPSLIYLLLTAWIIFGAFFIAKDTWHVMDEIRGQWLIGFAALGVGAMLAICSRKQSALTSERILLAIFVASFIHVLYTDFLGLSHFLIPGDTKMWRLRGLARGVDANNLMAILSLTILYVEIIFRSATGKRRLPLGWPLLAVATFLSFSAIYLTAMRNGFVVTLAISVLSLIFYLQTTKASLKKIFALGAVALILLTVFGIASVRHDKRWTTLQETIPIALDTETHKAWLDKDKYPYPTLADGSEVKDSNYERIAWITEGLKLAKEHPLGTGFSRYSYGRGITAKYGEGAIKAHSHSGILDLYLSTGAPGTLLWVALLISLLYHAMKNISGQSRYFSMLLILTIVAFGLRMIVDSIIRDNSLHSFLFLLAVFSVLIIKERVNENPDK